jgi:hypothetical protein
MLDIGGHLAQIAFDLAQFIEPMFEREAPIFGAPLGKDLPWRALLLICNRRCIMAALPLSRTIPDLGGRHPAGVVPCRRHGSSGPRRTAALA